MMITFSVITICLNSAATIRNTLASVANQDYGNINYIIVDGASSDGTLDIISQYRDIVDYLISEPDTGIYSAMNKGINAARGDVIFFLNSDDYFVDDHVLSDVAGQFEKYPHIDLLYGNIIWDIGKNLVVHKQPATITRRFLAKRTLIHQTVFAKKALFGRTGTFSEDLSVVSDYEWLLKVFLSEKTTYKHYDREICVMGTGGLSWSTKWEKERRKVMKSYFNFLEIALFRSIPLAYRNLRRISSTK